MCAATLLLLAALPSLAGRAGWCAGGEVVSVGEGGGGAPAFAPGQVTAVLAPAGHAAALDCRVLRLHDKSVSWVRSRDLQILTHAGAVFTADARVSVAATGGAAGGAAGPAGGAAGPAGGAAGPAGGATRHTLRIEHLRAGDAGRYECQVNTEPKMSLFFNLTVVDEPVPEVVVSVLGDSSVGGPAGGAARLACSARYSPEPRALPLPPLDIHWQKGDQPISLQSPRGGVALETERWAHRVESRLTLAELAAPDAGVYTCAAQGKAAALRLAIIDDEDHAEAMQRDQASSGAARPLGARSPPAALLAPALALALAFACR